MSGIGTRVADVLVVGGGHAGCEAALAAARLGKDVLLVTGNIDRIAAMSCNPAIGGVGKGHLVKELDVLGGEMGRVADDTGIHFRTLNESRGPAVRATRCQSDMERYRASMTRVVMNTQGLRVRQDDVVALHIHDEGSIPSFTDQPQHEMPAWTREFIHRYCPWGIGDVQLETRIGRIGELVPIVAEQCGCDLIALGWSQQLAHGRAPVVQETLQRSHLPVLLVPVELSHTLEGVLAAPVATT